MYQSPQHASPAPAVRRESHSSLLNPPGAQAVVGVTTTGPAKSRAPGHSIPLYVRLLAIRSRLDQRPGFWFQREPSPRYQRISSAFSESLGLPFPNPRTRVSSSVRLMSNSSATWHAMIRDLLAPRYCPWPCSRCEPHLALDAEEWAYTHARDANVMSGGAR